MPRDPYTLFRPVEHVLGVFLSTPGTGLSVSEVHRRVGVIIREGALEGYTVEFLAGLDCFDIERALEVMVEMGAVEVKQKNIVTFYGLTPRPHYGRQGEIVFQSADGRYKVTRQDDWDESVLFRNHYPSGSSPVSYKKAVAFIQANIELI